MTVNDFFHTGYDFPAYVEKLGDDGLKFVSRYGRIQLTPEDERFFRELKQHLNILIISESWCSDCVLNVPIIAKLAEINPQIKVVIFPRDHYPEIMDMYLTNGKRTIPAVIMFDDNFVEVGRWIERPLVVQKVFSEGTEAEIATMKRDYLQGLYLEETVREIRCVIEGIDHGQAMVG
jgi:hypothetical protein